MEHEVERMVYRPPIAIIRTAVFELCSVNQPRRLPVPLNGMKPPRERG